MTDIDFFIALGLSALLLALRMTGIHSESIASANGLATGWVLCRIVMKVRKPAKEK